jgi:hypothetical protein
MVTRRRRLGRSGRPDRWPGARPGLGYGRWRAGTRRSNRRRPDPAEQMQGRLGRGCGVEAGPMQERAYRGGMIGGGHEVSPSWSGPRASTALRGHYVRAARPMRLLPRDGTTGRAPASHSGLLDRLTPLLVVAVVWRADSARPGRPVHVRVQGSRTRPAGRGWSSPPGSLGASTPCDLPTLALPALSVTTSRPGRQR